MDFNLAYNEAPERGGREELLLESQEDQELSAGASTRQLVLNMISEDQTVDHTYMLMGNDHDTIFIDFSEYAGQEDTNFENSVQRANDCAQTSHWICALTFAQDFDQQNHTTTSLVRTYGNIPVIRSQKH